MSVIPQEHTFHCCAAPDIDTMSVNIAEHSDGSNPQTVLFSMGGSSVFIEDREEVTLIRDMLTVWLSRAK